MDWLKKQWAALPHQAQAVIVSFAGAFAATFIHAASDSACYSAICFKHYLGTALSSGLVTLRVFYMIPGKQPAPSTPEVPVAGK